MFPQTHAEVSLPTEVCTNIPAKVIPWTVFIHFAGMVWVFTALDMSGTQRIAREICTLVKKKFNEIFKVFLFTQIDQL